MGDKDKISKDILDLSVFSFIQIPSLQRWKHPLPRQKKKTQIRFPRFHNGILTLTPANVEYKTYGLLFNPHHRISALHALVKC